MGRVYRMRFWWICHAMKYHKWLMEIELATGRARRISLRHGCITRKNHAAREPTMASVWLRCPLSVLDRCLGQGTCGSKRNKTIERLMQKKLNWKTNCDHDCREMLPKMNPNNQRQQQIDETHWKSFQTMQQTRNNNANFADNQWTNVTNTNYICERTSIPTNK